MTVLWPNLHRGMMYLRAIITGIAGLAGSFSVLLADEKASSMTECPFSFELPSDIKPVKRLYNKETQDDPVVWNINCYPIPVHLPEVLFGIHASTTQRTNLTCVVEPMPPHRRICPTTSRWNGLDKIWISTLLGRRSTSSGRSSTLIEYAASSSDDYFLSIKADVKSKEHDALMKQTLSTMVKIAASVRRTSKSPLTSERHSPAITVNDTSVSAMVAIKPISGCPFEFELPGEVAPKMDGGANWIGSKGQLKSGRWVMLCGGDAASNAHLERTLDGLSCRVETTPPHHQICARSKRWNGTDRLSIWTAYGQTKVEFDVYTAGGQRLYFAIGLEKAANQALIEQAVGIAQAVSRSARLAK